MSKTLLALSVGLFCAAGAQAGSFVTSSAGVGSVPAAACPTGPGYLSLNTDCTPVQGSVACATDEDPQRTVENSYYRRYVLATGTTPGASVSSVHLGIENVISADGGTINGSEIRIHTIPTGTALTTGALTLIGSAPVPLVDGTVLSELDIAISPPAVVTDPATQDIVVEFFTPDLTETGGSVIFVGSNPTGTGASYLRAPGCGAEEPTDIGGLGFPNMKVIASLSGQSLPVSLQDFTIE